jgi:hypothetical protein
MTCKWSEVDMSQALYLLVCDYPEIPGTEVSGIKAVAQILGTPVGILRNQLTQAGTNKIGFEQAAAIMEICRQAGMEDWAAPLHNFNNRLHHIAMESTELHQVSDDCINRAASNAAAQLGQMIGTAHESLDDNVIHTHEDEKIEKWYRKTLTAICSFRARLRGRAKKDARVPA